MKPMEIPERWLQGRTRAHEIAGLYPRAALRQAIADWLEQEQLEREQQEEPR
jgi:hypothetical protein